MQINSALFLAVLLPSVLVGRSAFAQGSGNGNGTNGNSGSTGYSTHWSYSNSGSGPWYSDMSRWSNAPAPRVWTNSSRIVSRSGNGGPTTPAQVQAIVRQFQADREAFLTQQRALKEQLASVPEAERQRLRDQLRDQMQAWKEQQARLREQLKDQAERLRDQLRDHDRLMDRATGSTSGSSQGTGNGSGSGSRGR